jgi:poly-gamma-glutamate synthesis protein (capsule biosynthesis protein)
VRKIIIFLVTISVFYTIYLATARQAWAPSFEFKPTKQSSRATLLATGDVMLGRSVMATTLAKNDPNYPFIKVADELSQADITFINLENPIINNCPTHNTGFIFCADPKMIEGLKNAGVDIVNLANNHTLNYGREGLNQTIELLTKAGIDYVGENNLVVKKVGDTTFGFLGFERSQQANPTLTTVDRELIRGSDRKVDVLVVGIHWGVEYQDKALPGQRELARDMVEMGVDVVVGHHPHWVQDSEIIDGKPVYYSLGNFIFDQMWSEETKKGLVVKFDFENGKVVETKEKPVYIKNLGQPEFVEGN